MNLDDDGVGKRFLAQFFYFQQIVIKVIYVFIHMLEDGLQIRNNCLENSTYVQNLLLFEDIFLSRHTSCIYL